MAATRYESCAVVGSSPELLLYDDGAEIDAQDAVLRSNMAVVKGYETHAGSRTTVRVVNPVESIARARAKSESTTLIIKNQVRQWRCKSVRSGS